MNGVGIKKANQKGDKPTKPRFRCPLLEIPNLPSLMLIGTDTGPCVVLIRNRGMLSSKMTSNGSQFKIVCVQKSFLSLVFLFQSQSWLRESTTALFRQSAGYVLSTHSFHMMSMLNV